MSARKANKRTISRRSVQLNVVRAALVEAEAMLATYRAREQLFSEAMRKIAACHQLIERLQEGRLS